MLHYTYHTYVMNVCVLVNTFRENSHIELGMGCFSDLISSLKSHFLQIDCHIWLQNIEIWANCSNTDLSNLVSVPHPAISGLTTLLNIVVIDHAAVKSGNFFSSYCFFFINTLKHCVPKMHNIKHNLFQFCKPDHRSVSHKTYGNGIGMYMYVL